jgi:DNA invertase Pin-like site-specific DNA recombinase
MSEANQHAYPLLEALLRIQWLTLQPTYTNADIASLFDMSVRRIQNRTADGGPLWLYLSGGEKRHPQFFASNFNKCGCRFVGCLCKGLAAKRQQQPKTERNHMNFERKDGEPDMMRCASYLRIGSDMARQSSLEDQKQHCRKFAEDHGWIVPDAYVYTDAGKSGTSPAGRDGLNSLIIAAQSQPSPFRMVLIEETSRLARNLRVVLDIVSELALHGVHVYFMNQNLDSRDDHFRMMLTVSEIVDEQYIAGLSEKVRRGQMGRVISGFTSGGRCFGYPRSE